MVRIRISDVMSELTQVEMADLLRDLALNDNEAVPPVKIQEACTKNLEGLVGKIDALETGFTSLVERSRALSLVSSLPTETTCSSHRSSLAIQAGRIRRSP